MKRHYFYPSTRLSTQALELSLAAPQVMAQRMVRMALAGSKPTPQDQKEFHEMSDEKVQAFYQSWAAIWVQMFKSQLAVAEAMTTAFTTAMVAGKALSADSTLQAISREANKVLYAGMEPVHRKAVANAKRLAGLK
ncbi:MAG TPA: polyhydroxyalkanoate granule-associated phasin [Limnobacter sp.]|nr:polyhydroxyalkanoate granule-associated phasin [Limnobacter sp.]